LLDLRTERKTVKSNLYWANAKLSLDLKSQYEKKVHRPAILAVINSSFRCTIQRFKYIYKISKFKNNNFLSKTSLIVYIQKYIYKIKNLSKIYFIIEECNI
jgi:hypothetical protein